MQNYYFFSDKTLSSTLYPISILAGRDTRDALEVFAEYGLGGEVQFVGNLLDGHRGGREQRLALGDDVLFDEVERGDAVLLLHHRGEVLDRHTQFTLLQSPLRS